MRYVMMFKSDQEPEPGVSACKGQLPEMAALMDRLKQDGILIASEGLKPIAAGARVRHTGGKTTVTDGPFAEAKELIAGFALVEVGSKAEAVALAERFLTIAGGGTGDVLEVFAQPAAHS